ncbi:hypothetical protein [Candidatus Neoehrlichia procyonis]|uniref:Uncharacterized protein n=1 Tax=Candidatus Neoehrlichia procyonis str. RAC413 TaxID=1359163 RepID=A0A0F3NRY6_9RICK|nr:hypothetical protein [Candidatus Neoehrlichia lotoris]KJV69639.1 hypothetical protein NLO413_1039 [Candidatus Neoehrlichia lotoris str. RAC413]
MTKYNINTDNKSDIQNLQYGTFHQNFSSITLNSLIQEICTSNSVLSGKEALQDYATKNLIIGNKSIKHDNNSLYKPSLQSHIQSLIDQHNILPEIKYICNMYDIDHINFLERCPERYLLYLEYKKLFYNHYKFTPHIKLINELITNSHKKGFIGRTLLKSVRSAIKTNIFKQQTAIDIETQILSTLEEASLTTITIDPPKAPALCHIAPYSSKHYHSSVSNCITITEHMIINLNKISQFTGAMKITLSYKISLKNKHKKIYYNNIELLVEVPQQLHKYVVKINPHIIKLKKIINHLTKIQWKILSYVNIYRPLRTNTKESNTLVKQSNDLLSTNFTYSLPDITLSQNFFKKLNLLKIKKAINLSFLKAIPHSIKHNSLYLPTSLLEDTSLYDVQTKSLLIIKKI